MMDMEECPLGLIMVYLRRKMSKSEYLKLSGKKTLNILIGQMGETKKCAWRPRALHSGV